MSWPRAQHEFPRYLLFDRKLHSKYVDLYRKNWTLGDDIINLLIYNNNDNSMYMYLLSAHSIRFDVHGANCYYPGYQKDGHGKFEKKLLAVPIYSIWVERDNYG